MAIGTGASGHVTVIERGRDPGIGAVAVVARSGRFNVMARRSRGRNTVMACRAAPRADYAVVERGRHPHARRVAGITGGTGRDVINGLTGGHGAVVTAVTPAGRHFTMVEGSRVLRSGLRFLENRPASRCLFASSDRWLGVSFWCCRRSCRQTLGRKNDKEQQEGCVARGRSSD